MSRSRTISAMWRMSSGGIKPPVGFCGELSTSIFVFVDRRLRSVSRSKEKPRSSTSGMGTGTPPEKRIIDS